MAEAQAPKLVKPTGSFSKRGNAMVPLSVPRGVRSKLPRRIETSRHGIDSKILRVSLRNGWKKIVIRRRESEFESVNLSGQVQRISIT